MSIINSIDHVNVIAACDVLPFRLNKGLAKANSNLTGYSDYRQLLDNKDIDELVNKANQSKHIFQTGHQYHSSRLYTRTSW